jgi:tRNA(Ile)-lysidine synthase
MFRSAVFCSLLFLQERMDVGSGVQEHRMRRPLEQLVLSHIRDRRMIPAGARLAAAVSGGADSVALFRILQSIRRELGVTLCVAHFNHCLRGLESLDDAEFVAELARAHEVDFCVDRVDVAAEARRNGWNLEDAARRLRYGFFRRLAEEGRATHLAVAHTADDQAETVLAHLIRGTGPTGIAGIYAVAGMVVRPLLGFRRQQLREYLIDAGQPWREDPTNADRARLRSRIRLRLLPRLEREFSGRIVDHLSALARLSREEQVFWDALVDDRYHALVDNAGALNPWGSKSLAISVAGLLNPFEGIARQSSLPTANVSLAGDEWRPLTERLIRRCYKDLRGDCRELTLEHVEQVIRLAVKPSSGKTVQLPGGIRVARNFDALLFSLSPGARDRADRENKAGQIAYKYPVTLEGEATRVPVPEIGICFRLKTVDWGKARSETTGETQVLDVDSISAPLILRNWLPGDAYTPYGRSQPRKLKHMFLAARVPSAERKRWPVLESAGRLVWARRMPAARDFCASERTRVGLVIQEEAIE